MRHEFLTCSLLPKLLLVATTTLAIPSSAQRLPDKLRQVLQNDLQLAPTDLANAEAGRAATRIVGMGDPEDIFVVGVIRIATTPTRFLARYKNITEFEASPSVPAGGKFSTPPKDSDVAGVSLTKGEIDDLHDCEPGDCDYKIGDRGLERIRSAINWKSPDYVQQANQVIRRLWLEYLRSYQSTGNSALAAYHDTPKVFRVEDGLVEQLKKTSFVYRNIPELVDHLQNYPRHKLPNSEEFFYWQEADFGLKSVHRITHVVKYRKPSQYGEGAIIASKMLFASHYFRSALEFRLLLPTQSSSGKPLLYLVVLQRSFVDGLGGLKGRILRGPILSKTQEALERYLISVKGKLETT